MKLLYSSNIPGVLENISISQIKPFKFYYRNNDFYDDEIKDLQFSLKQHGLLQPIVARNLGSYYEIVTGYRRYIACKSLGWRKILCHVIDVTDKEAFEISLMSNLQRKQLNPIEEARAFDKYLSKCKWGDVTELAYKIGKSRRYIYRRLKLLDFPLDIIDAISRSEIEPSIAEELSPIKDIDLKKNLLNHHVLEKKYSCKQIRQIVKASNSYELSDNCYLELEKNKEDLYIDMAEIDETTQKLFNKMIILLKNTIRNMTPIIEDSEDNWIVYNTFMQHKKILDTQIDILIKEKKKIK